MGNLASEVMEVYHDEDEIKLGKFFDWWTMFGDKNFPEERRGASDEYTDRFKYARLGQDEVKFDINSIERKREGKQGTPEYRVQFFMKGTGGGKKQISPWHDIPLSAGKAADG